MKKITDNIL